MKNLKKVWKIFIMSAIVCFSLTLTLMIINAVVGISIRLNFYLLLFTILTAGFTVASKVITAQKTLTPGITPASFTAI